jgi:hypothetical protein
MTEVLAKLDLPFLKKRKKKENILHDAKLASLSK